MANPFTKGWKYLTASLDQKIDENADPLIQIKQAADAAKEQHAQIAQQASAVIGNRNQLEMKLNRLLEEQKSITDRTRQALQLADKANLEGDAAKAAEFGNAAEIYASQLVNVEQQLEETKTLHGQAVQAAKQASEQVKQSEARLAEHMAQIDQLTQQVQQTKMQETTNKAMNQMDALAPDDDVPTLDAVREKIERRYANALGAQELTQHTMDGRMAEIEASGADFKAASRLEEIRAAMRNETAGGQALEGKKDAPALDKPADPDADEHVNEAQPVEEDKK